MLPWWIRWEHFVAGKQGMFQTGNAILTSYLKEYSLYGKKIGPCSSRSLFVQNLWVTVHHWKNLQMQFLSMYSSAVDCSLYFTGLGPGELWGFWCCLFGGRCCIDAVTVEDDKIFAWVTSCTQCDVGTSQSTFHPRFLYWICSKKLRTFSSDDHREQSSSFSCHCFCKKESLTVRHASTKIPLLQHRKLYSIKMDFWCSVTADET